MLKRINLLFLVSILFILSLTLIPEHLSANCIKSGEVNLIPFRTISGLTIHYSFGGFIINNIGNIILFVPFGFLLALKFRNIDSVTKAYLVGAILSITIEIFQLFIPNRWTDIDDIILNTLGTGIGYILSKSK